MVLRFLSGIAGYCKCIIEKRDEGHFFIQCLFEAQNHKKQCILPVQLPHPLTFELTSMSSQLDVYALGYCITNTIAGKTKRVKFVSFTKSLQPFIQGLNTHSPLSSNLEFHVVHNWVSFTDFSSFIPVLTSLHFVNCGLTYDYMMYLSEVTSKMNSLTELEIHCTEPFPCLDGIVKILNVNEILKHMFLSSFWLLKDIRTVTEALKANSTLQSLKIGVNNVAPGSIPSNKFRGFSDITYDNLKPVTSDSRIIWMDTKTEPFKPVFSKSVFSSRDYDTDDAPEQPSRLKFVWPTSCKSVFSSRDRDTDVLDDLRLTQLAPVPVFSSRDSDTDVLDDLRLP